MRLFASSLVTMGVHSSQTRASLLALTVTAAARESAPLRAQTPGFTRPICFLATLRDMVGLCAGNRGLYSSGVENKPANQAVEHGESRGE